MELLTKDGKSKLVERCTYPLTGVACVERVYTDLATFHISTSGVAAHDLADGLPFDELVKLVGLPLARPDERKAA
jgi:3-oxoadipate CoA-transferase beta subunit